MNFTILLNVFPVNYINKLSYLKEKNVLIIHENINSFLTILYFI